MRDEAFGLWDLLRMPHDMQLSPASPVVVGARDLRVTLPYGMTFPQFDARLTAALLPASLKVWTATQAGAALLPSPRHRPRQPAPVR